MKATRVLWIHVLSLLAVTVAAHPGVAFPKDAPRKKDGKNNVVGAVWEVEAKNTKTAAVQSFKLRAKNGELFDKFGKRIGTLKIVQNGKTRRTQAKFFEGSPLPGTVLLTFNKIGHWAGVMKTKEADWEVTVNVLDR
jgi:hypothetical protein